MNIVFKRLIINLRVDNSLSLFVPSYVTHSIPSSLRKQFTVKFSKCLDLLNGQIFSLVGSSRGKGGIKEREISENTRYLSVLSFN